MPVRQLCRRARDGRIRAICGGRLANDEGTKYDLSQECDQRRDDERDVSLPRVLQRGFLF